MGILVAVAIGGLIVWAISQPAPGSGATDGGGGGDNLFTKYRSYQQTGDVRDLVPDAIPDVLGLDRRETYAARNARLQREAAERDAIKNLKPEERQAFLEEAERALARVGYRNFMLLFWGDEDNARAKENQWIAKGPSWAAVYYENDLNDPRYRAMVGAFMRGARVDVEESDREAIASEQAEQAAELAARAEGDAIESAALRRPGSHRDEAHGGVVIPASDEYPPMAED